jgi:hypothetical protein
MRCHRSGGHLGHSIVIRVTHRVKIASTITLGSEEQPLAVGRGPEIVRVRGGEAKLDGVIGSVKEPRSRETDAVDAC